MPSDRTPRNPNEVILVPMIADALRLLRSALQCAAYSNERSAHTCVLPKNRAQSITEAERFRGLADDLSVIFDGRSCVVGDSLVQSRAEQYARDKQQAK